MVQNIQGDMEMPDLIVDDQVGGKGKVKDGLSYSTTATKTGGVWIDGSPIWRKVVAFNGLPNNTYKDVAHGIALPFNIVDMRAFSYAESAGYAIPEMGAALHLLVTDDVGYVRIITSYDGSSHDAYVIIDYVEA